jgi:hypothetical protein
MTGSGAPWSRPVPRPTPTRTSAPTFTRLVTRKNATVRRATRPAGMPPRRRIQAPSARPPAPPTLTSEFVASSAAPIS